MHKDMWKVLTTCLTLLLICCERNENFDEFEMKAREFVSVNVIPFMKGPTVEGYVKFGCREFTQKFSQHDLEKYKQNVGILLEQGSILVSPDFNQALDSGEVSKFATFRIEANFSNGYKQVGVGIGYEQDVLCIKGISNWE